MTAPSPLHDRLIQFLRDQNATIREVQHAPTFTSEESALARGEPLGCGAKALLLKTDEEFRLFVLPADRQLDSAGVKRALELRRLRFASPEELLELTGLVPGSVPPFGEPLLPFRLYADVEVGTRFPQLAFNAGSLTPSVIMPATDWDRLAKPIRLKLTKV